MKNYFNIGIGFGVASGVITTLGLMVGLYASTHSKGYVLSGILTIAVADAFSDAAGIHFSEESKGKRDVLTKDIWFSTVITFLSKFFIALSFVPAMLLTSLKAGILYNIVWSFLLVGVFSYLVAKKRKESKTAAIVEHFSIVIVVIIITYYTGRLIDSMNW